MKSLLLVSLFLLLIITPAFGALSDKTGLVNNFDVETSGYAFEIKTISNFNVMEYEFDKDEKRLTLFIDSGLENNLGEIIIPQLFLSGNFTFYLNDMEYDQKIKSNETVSFITLNFTGTGNNKIDIIATETFAEVEEKSKTFVINESAPETGGGCLIATATFGSELAPQVQQLRELRDNTILSTESGSAFMSGFNRVYYSFSPAIADLERESPVFKETMKLTLTPMLSTLSLLNHVDIDSEHEMLGYGISLIILNIGIYFGIPASVIVEIRKKL